MPVHRTASIEEGAANLIFPALNPELRSKETIFPSIERNQIS